MSTTSSPSRRGADVPGIDTHFDPEKHSTALSYAGCLTPPQSAHESRCGSLAYGAFPDASYNHGVPLPCVSQPVTPIQAVSPCAHDFTPQWHPRTSPQAHQAVQHAAAYPVQHVTTASFATCLQQAACSSATEYGLSDQMLLDTAWPAPQRMEWTSHHDYNHIPDYSGVSLSSSLLQSQTGLSTAPNHSNSSYADGTYPHETLDLHTAHAAHSDIFGTSSAQVVHPQQITVAPSMLTPNDGYVMQPYQEYSSPNGARQSLASSFTTSYGSFSFSEYDVPTTSVDTYPYSDEECVLVKGEYLSPTPGMSRTPTNDSRAARRRRSTARAPRISHGQRYHSHWVGGAATGIRCEIVGDANDVTYDVGGLSFPTSIAKQSRKMHRCNHVDDYGEPCLRAFERGEHLKRHMASHSTDRKYECGLPECKHRKGISRGDNAGDHFRTHLKDTEKGRRNKKFEWPEVRRYIERSEKTNYQFDEMDSNAKGGQLPTTLSAR
ncbi:hypothetical protein LTS14_000772 [Recurvomyces mirabilis]|uniref:uncharacterized protein n=1 Tax=Recurvomyces mirabilis TaxID=574656 RepID=UPI002DE0A3DE|nr:hypothetical protein LTS14_000772 [Recurvomyces mirabilis]